MAERSEKENGFWRDKSKRTNEKKGKWLAGHTLNLNSPRAKLAGGVLGYRKSHLLTRLHFLDLVK